MLFFLSSLKIGIFPAISGNKDVTAIATLQYEPVSLREFRKERNTYRLAVTGLIPGLGKSSAEGTGNAPQQSCLGNPMDRGAWWATIRRVAQNQTQLSNSLQPVPYGEPWGNSGRENTGHRPQIAEVQIRKMVSVSFFRLRIYFVLVVVESLSCVVLLCDHMDCSAPGSSVKSTELLDLGYLAFFNNHLLIFGLPALCCETSI